MTGQPYTASTELSVIAQLENPSHISMVDFDRDGIKDFLVGGPWPVPARGPHARCGRAVARHGLGTLPAVRARRLAARGRRRSGRLQRRRHAGPGGGRVRLAQGRQPLRPREPHDRLLASVLRVEARGSAAGRDPRHPRRPEQGRPHGSRRRLRAAVRAGRGVHQQRHASGQLHAAGRSTRPRIRTGARRASRWSTSMATATSTSC